MLRLATRGSELARTQSQWVADQLTALGHPTELLIIKTRGDLNQVDPLHTLGGKGLFTKEIEVALLQEEAELAVHSLKDLPTELPDGLVLACTPPREDPRDALIALHNLENLPPTTIVGTGSQRRQAQVARLRPDLITMDIRGNVPTRIQKWRDGLFGAVILAAAGLNRLGGAGLQPHELHLLDHFIPAPCQGILGIQCRANDTATRAILQKLNHPESDMAARAERAFLEELDGGCHIPAGALFVQNTLVASLHHHVLRIEGEDPEELGKEAARRLKALCSP